METNPDLNKKFFSKTNPESGKEGHYILRVEGIRKTFGGLIALDDVNLEVKKNSLTMIIGPNGSGKTTLLNIISGFIKPDSGRVVYKNNEITELPPHIINKIGLVRTFQIPSPFMNLTVTENLLVASRRNPGESFLKSIYHKSWIREEEEDVKRAWEIIKNLKLDAVWDSKASELSGGQLKLLEIGRALMNEAETILMDEPAAGVNPTLAHEVFDVMKKLTMKQYVTFLIIEHRLEIALKYVDWVYAMARGRVIAKGRPEEVIRNPLVIESYLSA